MKRPSAEIDGSKLLSFPPAPVELMLTRLVFGVLAQPGSAIAAKTSKTSRSRGRGASILGPRIRARVVVVLIRCSPRPEGGCGVRLPRRVHVLDPTRRWAGRWDCPTCVSDGV